MFSPLVVVQVLGLSKWNITDEEREHLLVRLWIGAKDTGFCTPHGLPQPDSSSLASIVYILVYSIYVSL